MCQQHGGSLPRPTTVRVQRPHRELRRKRFGMMTREGRCGQSRLGEVATGFALVLRDFNAWLIRAKAPADQQSSDAGSGTVLKVKPLRVTSAPSILFPLGSRVNDEIGWSPNAAEMLRGDDCRIKSALPRDCPPAPNGDQGLALGDHG